jgi:DNA repair photolyase
MKAGRRDPRDHKPAKQKVKMNREMTSGVETTGMPGAGCPSVADTASTINGKPVAWADTRILNPTSGFEKKLLCSGPTFTAGTSCVFTCVYCYVPSMLEGKRFVRDVLKGRPFQSVVIRRENAAQRLAEDLRRRRKLKDDPDCVIYGSPLVEVAPTVELADETVQVCLAILRETRWQIRLLSKSPLLTRVAMAIPVEFKSRVIYGLSTGTMDDCVAKAIEPDAPPPSKRLAALKELQEAGFRTFAMLCPVLPLGTTRDENRAAAGPFVERAKELIDFDLCEHIWAEPINEKGGTFDRVLAALQAAAQAILAAPNRPETVKLHQAIERIEAVKDDQVWEEYARSLFEALARSLPPGKLRFLQYTTKSTAAWWVAQKDRGAVPLIQSARARKKGEVTSAEEAELKRKRRAAALKAWVTIRASQAAKRGNITGPNQPAQ